MVAFADGSIKAQLGVADMRIPIAYALSYPERTPLSVPRFSFAEGATLSFQPPDLDKFRCLALAFEALQMGGNAPCALNAANELAVAAFLREQIAFPDIARRAEHALRHHHHIAQPTLEELWATDEQVRAESEK
jgi:1-deoxy-D-xylulose-5-phosphate reductoisomerase